MFLHLTPSWSRKWYPSWLNSETPLQCITRSWFSWLGGHSVSGSSTKHPPPSSWTPARPRDVCPLLYILMIFDCRTKNSNQKTIEVVLDFGRAAPTKPSLLYINRAAVEIIPSFKYLKVHLSYTLIWCTNSTTVFKKAHQCFYLVRNLRRAELNRAIYSCVVESVWFTDLLRYEAARWQKMDLQQAVKSAQRTIGCSLPPIGAIYNTRWRDRAICILNETTHLIHQLFTPLLSGQRLHSIWSKTSRKKSSFHVDAIRCSTFITAHVKPDSETALLTNSTITLLTLHIHSNILLLILVIFQVSRLHILHKFMLLALCNLLFLLFLIIVYFRILCNVSNCWRF